MSAVVGVYGGLRAVGHEIGLEAKHHHGAVLQVEAAEGGAVGKQKDEEFGEEIRDVFHQLFRLRRGHLATQQIVGPASGKVMAPVAVVEMGADEFDAAAEVSQTGRDRGCEVSGWQADALVAGGKVGRVKGRLSVEGAAGAKLTARAISGGTLAVYGQPQRVGELTVAGTVSSGLTVEGGFLSAGKISGETFAVVGGTLEADAVSSARKTIDGGSVKVGQTTFVNRANQPLYRVTVKVEGLRVEKLRVEGLKDYGTNDIYAIDDRVYLWLPKGEHWFTISDGTKTHCYFADVNNKDIVVEPLSLGFTVNGEDVFNDSGTGWSYDAGVLSLNSAMTYVLTGLATNDELQVSVAQPGATVVLSNTVVMTSGRPALVVEKDVSLQMTGGESYLVATNVFEAVTVAEGATLTVDLPPRTDRTTPAIGVFNNGGSLAIGGTGKVAVNGGTLALKPVRAPVAMPDSPINTSSFLSSVFSCFCLPLANTMIHAITSTTMVRMAVARLEFTPLIPTFARIDVSAAKTADNNANTKRTKDKLLYIKKINFYQEENVFI